MDISLEQSLRNWLEKFAGYVRERNFDSARAMFSNDVIGYGTWTERMAGIDSLLSNQWSHVWPQTEAFTFDQGNTDFWLDNAEYPTQCTIASLWSSSGIDENGDRFKRRGRATIVLQRKPGEDWRAAHTHFSFFPHNNLTGFS